MPRKRSDEPAGTGERNDNPLLERSIAMLQLVMDSIPQRVFWKDRNFVYRGCNRVFAEDAGIDSPEDIVGMNDFELSWKESAPLYRADDRDVMENDLSKINYEEPQKRADGSRLWLRTTKLPIKNTRGEIIGVFGSYEDITDSKLADERHRILEAQLRQSQKMEALGTLAGGIAHDFNNILSAIMGYGELVHDDLPEGDPRRDDLQHLLHASERGRQLVQRILAYSRAGKQETTYVDLGPVLDDTLRLLRATLPSTIELRPEFGPIDGVVNGSDSDIHQIVVNLATNAAFAMGESGGILTIGLKKEAHKKPLVHHHGELAPGDYFHFTITDTGHGIGPAHLERIFDPFFTTKEVGKGTGLGLSVVIGIVSSLGGAIDVKSKPGKGTRFDLYLPYLERPEVPVAPVTEDEVGGTERILLIDDERPLVDLGARVLSRFGYKVSAYDDPDTALNAFTKSPDSFDVVVTDYTMPRITGIDLARKIRAKRPDVPIVLVTGFSDGVTRETALAAGIPGFVMKPYRAEALAAAVRAALNAS